MYADDGHSEYFVTKIGHGPMGTVLFSIGEERSSLGSEEGSKRGDEELDKWWQEWKEIEEHIKTTKGTKFDLEGCRVAWEPKSRWRLSDDKTALKGRISVIAPENTRIDICWSITCYPAMFN